jgi:hypothetical protein
MVLFIFSNGCKEKDDNGNEWKNCYECNTESWIGEFTGTGNYTNIANPANADNKPVSIKIEETAPDYLIVYFSCPNYISATISGSLVSNYVISFAGTGSSITATLDTKDQGLKLSGTVKKFHIQADSTILDELINFETYKQ